jgi:hypothetical protein
MHAVLVAMQDQFGSFDDYAAAYGLETDVIEHLRRRLLERTAR